MNLGRGSQRLDDVDDIEIDLVLHVCSTFVVFVAAECDLRRPNTVFLYGDLSETMSLLYSK